MDTDSERLKFIPYKQKQILFIDFSGCTPDQVLKLVPLAKNLIAKQPPGSLLTLTNVKDGRFNPAVVQAMKEFTAHNKAYVKKAAVIGLSGVQKIIYIAVVKFSGRNLPVFNSAEQAKEWLIKEGDDAAH